jgi:hypothetical protein
VAEYRTHRGGSGGDEGFWTGKCPAIPIVLLSATSLLLDSDGLAFPLGISYGAPWGHRGGAYSLAFVGGLSPVLAALPARTGDSPPVRTFASFAAVAASLAAEVLPSSRPKRGCSRRVFLRFSPAAAETGGAIDLVAQPPLVLFAEEATKYQYCSDVTFYLRD